MDDLTTGEPDSRDGRDVFARAKGILGLCCLLAASTCCTAAEADDTLQRWAVVAAEPLRDTGFSDLLAAELSAREGLELVERENLAEILAELELSASMGAEAAAKRVELGRLLSANALVLVSLEERERPPDRVDREKRSAADETETFLRLVISDCRYGARLRLEYLPYSADRLDRLSVGCADLVDQTRSHFAGGVEQVIAVTPFLSKNLTHDYDHLQAGYAYLVESALMSYPGTAVVETEEARTIRRELEVTGSELNDRVLPLLIEGEYEMWVDRPNSEPAVQLDIRATDGKSILLQRRWTDMELSEVAELLRESIPHQIVQLTREATLPGLSRRRQFALLAERAGAFERFGAYEHSTGLREAALLLQPDDLEQRLALIGDHLRWSPARQHARFARAVEARRAGTASVRGADESVQAEDLQHFRTVAQHVEHVVRSRALNPRGANHLLAEVYRRMTPGGRAPSPAGKRFAEEKREVARDLFWRVYPLFPSLDYELRQGAHHAALAALEGGGSDFWRKPRSPLRQYSEWTSSAGSCLAFQFPGITLTTNLSGWDDSRTLDDLFRFLTEVTLRDVPLPFMAMQTTYHPPFDFNNMIGTGRLEAAEVREFYERLKGTGKPLHEFYARLGLLAMQVYVYQCKGLDADALQEIDWLMQFVGNHDTQETRQASIAFTYRRQFDRLRTEIVKKLELATPEKRHALPKNTIPEVDPAPRVTFAPIEGLQVDWVGLRKCMDTLDLAWSMDTVYALSPEGPPAPIFIVDQGTNSMAVADQVYSVEWDGQYVWIACMASGIWAASPAGRIVGHVTSEVGLPAYTQQAMPVHLTTGHPSADIVLSQSRLTLCPVEPGKCVAIGAVEGRCWFAQISLDEDPRVDIAPRVTVFHQATKLSSDEGEDSRMDTERSFSLHWITEYHPRGDADRRLLLVGRQSRGVSERFPLAVDLRSLKVFVVPLSMSLPGYSSHISCYGIENDLLVPHPTGIDRFTPESTDLRQWTRQSLVSTKTHRDRKLRRQLIQHEKALFNPGSEWRRIDVETWETEKLTRLPLPLRQRFQHYGVSAHHGLVAWNTDDQLWRVSIDSPPGAKHDPDVLSTNQVPAIRRADHHQAVEAIRRLGGSVDMEWGRCPHHLVISERIEWRTIVYLPEAWTGEDAGLKHLKDLHNLRDLYLVGAAVTDDGLRTIGRLGTVESLCLVETQATDAGLAHLKGLNELKHLRLEGSAGKREFTDRGLESIQDLPKLQRLTLYGPGFTDESFKSLTALPRLLELWLLDTGITKPCLSRLAASGKRSLRYHQNEYGRVSN